jgi:hypothetical protein
MMPFVRRILERLGLCKPEYHAADRALDALHRTKRLVEQEHQRRTATGNPVADMVTGTYRPRRGER